MSDLAVAVKTLQAKQADQSALFRYYVGDQPLRYAADRLKEIFENRLTTFVQNWCAVVIDTVVDRLNLPSFDVAGDEGLSQRLNQLYTATRLAVDSDTIMRAALVTPESYVVAWRNGDEIEAFYNDPRLCHVFYEADNPRRKRYGVKWWRDDDDVWRLNLYYADRIEHYVGNKRDDPQETSFREESTEPNPWGVVPLFHFYRDRWLATSELANVIPLQDAVNKLLGDMMVAAEFGAFGQRWVITNGDITALKNKPNEIWGLSTNAPGEQPVSLGQFQGVDLANYLDAIDRLAASIAVITRTPKHYLFQDSGQPPSGEALVTMEAPLTRKVKQYQERFGLAWQELAAFLLLLDGSAVDPLDIVPQWTNAETVQPRTQAEIRKMGVEAGIPLTTLLRDEGWMQQELDDMEEDRAAEQERDADRRGTIGDALLAQFERGGQPTQPTRPSTLNGQGAPEAQR